MAEERDVLTVTVNNPLCIVHFRHPDFRSCAIMSSHLEKLARTHVKTKFCQFNASQGLWICQKLNIQTLPAVLCFIDGVVKDRVIGFDELGGSDTFSTATLEARLARSKVIAPPDSLNVQAHRSLFGYAPPDKSNDSDDDD